MSIVIRIPADELPKVLRGEGEKIREIIRKAVKAAAMRLKTYLVRRTDALGITHSGIYKGSFRATDNSVVNDAPHAGIVELGARPHPVSKEGREAIKQWAMVKLGLSAQDAESAAWAIANKIKLHGQEGRFVMRDAIPMALEFYKKELTRLIRASAGKKPRT